MGHNGEAALTWNEERMLSGRGLTGDCSLVNAVLARCQRALWNGETVGLGHTKAPGTAVSKTV